MKNRTLFFVGVICAMCNALAGCHKTVSFAVQDNLTTASIYAAQGDTLEWDVQDPNSVPFEIKFPYGSPCKSDDSLKGTRVLCHVGQSGTYIYQIQPSTPGRGNGPFHFAQVGGCTGCKGVASSSNRGVGSHNASNPADVLIYIGCDNNQKAVTIEIPHPPISAKQVIEWTALGPPPSSYGATFASGASPCTTGSGPFFGSGAVCTIAGPPGSYSYTVAREDCNNNTPSNPMNLTVQ